LKAKYYPRGCLIDTVFSANSSYTWQSILHGLELLKKGILWRVGNGSQIRIWRDPWIPRAHSYRVTSHKGRCRLKWVSELLNSQGYGWDHDKLVRIFNQADAEMIAKINIPPRMTEDVLAWPLEKSGLFSVRSAYYLGLYQRDQNECQASSSRPAGDRKLWKNVWGGNVMPKVNVFTWKLARNALPTRRRKFTRKMEQADTCLLCGLAAETSFHATVECPQAFNLRQAMRDHWKLPDEEWFRYTGPDWLLLLLDRCSFKQRDLTKLILWRAWTVHNNITHQSGSSILSDSVYLLLNLVASCDQVKTKEAVISRKGKEPCSSPDNRGGTGDELCWKPPPEGWAKINFDGSFVENNGDAGAGVIARNHHGDVIFTAWRSIPNCSSAVEAEARACLEGIKLAVQWIRGPVLLETDCARVHVAMSSEEDRSEISFIIREAKAHAQWLAGWDVTQANRECNIVAHELAHLARRTANTSFWLGRAPACVTDQVIADCNPSCA
jgi:ribonuclease HI